VIGEPHVMLVVRLGGSHVTHHTVVGGCRGASYGGLRRARARFVAAGALSREEVRRSIVAEHRLVGVVTGEALELAAAFSETAREEQAVDLRRETEFIASRLRIAKRDHGGRDRQARVPILERRLVQGHPLGEVRVAQMAREAHLHPQIRREALGIHDRGVGLPGRCRAAVPFRDVLPARTVAALAADAVRNRLCVLVVRARQELHPIVVAVNARPPDVAREIAIVDFVAGTQVPDRLLGLPTHRRLEELPAF
jgi:hypothetical protein